MQFTGGNGPTFGVTHRMMCHIHIFNYFPWKPIYHEQRREGPSQQ